MKYLPLLLLLCGCETPMSGLQTVVTAPILIGDGLLETISSPISPDWTNGVVASPRQWEHFNGKVME
jgi:hypothetical protein